MGDTYCIDYHMIGEGAVPLTTDESAQPFVATITGSGPPVASFVGDVAGANGVMSLALEATSEIQNLCVSWGNVLSLDIDNLIDVEFRARLGVALGSTAATTQLAFGLASERNDAIDTIAEAALFRVLGDASSAVTVETDDGTVNNDDVATGEAIATTFKKFVISFEKGTDDVRFYMDGGHGLTRVAAATTFDMSNYSNSLQFYAQIQKAANTDVGTLQIDRFTVRFKEPV